MMNLLPKPKQQEVFYQGLFHSILIAIEIGFIILFLGLMTQVVLYFYLDKEAQSSEAKVLTAKTQNGKKEYADQRAKVRDINIKIKDFQTLLNSSPKWSVVLTAFSKNIPPGVKISSFSSDTISKKVQINGTSPTRELVIQLYNNINNDKEFFKDINYPLENVTKPIDVSFKFTFFIKEGIMGPELPLPTKAVAPKAVNQLE